MTASWTKTLRSFSVAGIAAALAFTPALMGSANATPVRPWMNTALSPEQRAAKLISAMNLSQKIHMLSGTVTLNMVSTLKMAFFTPMHRARRACCTAGSAP